MGIISKLWGGVKGAIAGAIGGFKGSSDSSQGTSTRARTLLEPDKVKVAEIEAETERILANKERERIELAKQAKIDILQFETQSQMDIERAKVEGDILLMNTLVEMQEKLTAIAQKRLEIIMNGSMKLTKDIEDFYSEVIEQLETKDRLYTQEILPGLLKMLEQYEPGSASHRIYEKRIIDDIEKQRIHHDKQVDEVLKRQNLIIADLMESKNKIMIQTNEMTAGFIESIKEYAKQLAVKRVESLPMNEE